MTKPAKTTQAERRYKLILAAWEASGRSASNSELAAQVGVSRYTVQRALKAAGVSRRLPGAGAHAGAKSGAHSPVVAPTERNGMLPPAPAAAPGPDDLATALQAYQDELAALGPEDVPPELTDAFRAGWEAREAVADAGMMVSESIAYLRWFADQEAAANRPKEAAMWHGKILDKADKVARHRPAAKSTEHMIDPTGFPEMAHGTAAKLRRTVGRLQAERAEVVQRQLGVATERGGEYLEGTTDTLRVTGDLPGDGGDDEGIQEAR
jgi:hypothetical protein